MLFGHMIASGVAGKLAQQCPVTPDATAPYRLAYTGQTMVDTRLCLLTSFFAHGLRSKAHPFIGHLLAQFPSFVMFPVIESLREGRPKSLGFPLALGLAYQNFGGAIIVPLFWMLFVLVGGPKSITGPSSVIPRPLAEGALFGMLFGYVLPSTVMYMTVNPYVTAAWQVFPIGIWLFQFIWLIVRAVVPPVASPSGYKVVQAIHIINFLLGVVSHLTLVLPIVSNTSLLRETFVPSWSVPPTSTSTIATGVHHFLQWDGIIITGSALIMTLWFARTGAEQLALLVWNVVATFVLGPGAAFSGAVMWRESVLKTSSEIKSKEE